MSGEGRVASGESASETLLILSARLGYTPEATLQNRLATADGISRMLAGLIASLKARR